ncbi:SMI1/KNR4 family protein [Streptomyces sp. NBC_00083]|uniref:SMI1/KNR4 family protein n=1 Tax=Streptomyces sp. NBC_00083 TaxID=2975647 RepID=UPI0022543FB3|nr:SMI1/KNR4 family protein [Streptomyces sp. NBC_00083]MCX5387431.1 SMI1/KNR4 family protein [Streptomyces sp. NBC_00083]
MITLTVDESWDRIENWLARHAPVTYELLRPPALLADIAAAELRLGVAFPPDLRESLLRHDGVELQDGTLRLDYYGPLSAVEEIVRSAEFLREVGEDVAEEEDELHEEERDEYAYWPHERLLITLGIGWQSSDGLFQVTRPGPHHGRIGRYFDESGSAFTPWSGLRHVLSDFATALDNGLPFDGRMPLAHEGRLIWDAGGTVIADPTSALDVAARVPEPQVPAAAEPAPPVPRPDGTYATITFGSGGFFGSEPAPLVQPDVVFVAGIDPGELLDRLGALPATAGPRSREQARLSADSPWAAHRPLVRAGSCGDGWSYATQEGGDAQFGRPEVLARLSRGTRVVRLVKQGREVCVSVVEDGRERPEAGHRIESPREDYVTEPDGQPVLGPGGQQWQRIGVDPWPGSTAAYARLLAGLTVEHGIGWDPADDAEVPLASALLLPVLDEVPEVRHPVTVVRDFDLGALVERTPPERLRSAVAAQLARLASETGIDGYPEIARALEQAGRGEPVDLTADGALDLRMRTIGAETRAVRGLLDATDHRPDPAPVTEADLAAWQGRDAAAGALRQYLLLPLPAAARTVLSLRRSVHWRDELAADLSD